MKRLLFIAVLISFATLAVYAGGQNKAGTSAAPELLIPVGARYIGMGGSPVAIAKGLEAIYWNPAGVDLVQKTANILFSYRKYIADINVNFLAVSAKFGFGSFAFSLRAFDLGDIPITTMDEPDGTGEIFSPTYFVAGLTYSRRLTDRIAVGATINVIHESWARVSATGVGLDFGVQYHNLFLVPGLSIGVAVKNIGVPMRYGGSGLWVEATALNSERGLTFYKVEAAEFDLPSVIEIGVAYNLMLGESGSLKFAGTFQNNNYAYDEYRVGFEYSFRDIFFVRAGYLFAPRATNTTPHIFQNFTAGAGLHFGNLGGLDLSLDYAYVPVKFFTSNHVFSLKLGF